MNAEFERIRKIALTPVRTMTEKASRTKRVNTANRNNALAVEFAIHINAGRTTAAARAKMGIGMSKAKAVRAIAVRLGWIRPHQLKP